MSVQHVLLTSGLESANSLLYWQHFGFFIDSVDTRANFTRHKLNPRSDGGPRQLRTDGGRIITYRYEISKTKQAGRQTVKAWDTSGQGLQFLLRSFSGQFKNDVTGIKSPNIVMGQ